MRHTAVILLSCAWVLWGQHSYQSSILTNETWEPVSAHETKPACEARMPVELQRAKDDFAQMAQYIGGHVQRRLHDVLFRDDRSSTTYRVLCLPETVDPRPPK